MRKFFKKDGEIYEFAQGGSQDSLVTDDFVDQARIALNLTDEQVDEMWEQALTP